jgi:hypothetical protein
MLAGAMSGPICLSAASSVGVSWLLYLDLAVGVESRRLQ